MKVDFLIFSSVGPESDTPTSSSRKTWRALGPSKIADILRKGGYSAQLINFATFYPLEELVEMTEKFVDKDTMLCVSTTFLFGDTMSQKKMSNQQLIVKHLREKFGCKVMLGGPTPDFYKEQFNPDYMIKGFAENKILDFANQVKNHGLSKKILPLWDIKSCSHQWHASDYIMPNETLPLEIGRGCIFSCKYCKFEYIGKKRGEYVRDMSLIRDELIMNQELYGVTNYMLMDDTFNDDIYKMEEWCKMVDDLPFSIQYTAYCRGDLLHRFQDVARELYRSGLKGCTMGIESMNPKAAKIIGKTWSSKHAKDFIPYFVHDICKGDTITQLNFIAGLPGDTLSDAWSWLEWAKEHKIPSVEISALRITNPKFYPDEAAYSDFDLNAETKYGYRFPHKRLPLAWENDQMTWHDANKEAKKMRTYINENFNETAWSSFASMSLGYTVSDILSKSAKDFYNDPTYIERTDKWFNEYKNSIDKQ